MTFTSPLKPANTVASTGETKSDHRSRATVAMHLRVVPAPHARAGATGTDRSIRTHPAVSRCNRLPAGLNAAARATSSRQPGGDGLGLAHDAEDVAAGKLREIAIGPTATDQLGEEYGVTPTRPP